MVVLTGINLNKRHQELNAKVNEAAKNLVNFEEIKNTPETSDVDMLFKINLASKYRNINFILDTLKSGDNLYISKVLSCEWIANDEFAQYINPKYLEQNILQFLSQKMKKKVFTALSLRIRNVERAEEFYQYCTCNRMFKHAMNFLLHTKESFKIEMLTVHLHMYHNLGKNEKYMEHLIGNSFVLAECYLKTLKQSTQTALHNLRYLYSISSNAYLDLLEKYHPRYSFYVYSKRLSESILKKHKERVVSDPFLYLNILRRNSVLTYSNSEDAKLYAIKLMPKGWKQFWFDRYYDSKKWFLDLIPLGERFNFVKCIFTEKYPGHKFEDNFYFFIYNHYEMMTPSEKEEWALRQVATGEEAHGSGNDFMWYRFVNFSLAFEELKKYILIASDSAKISKILDILVVSGKSQNELTKLLDYYYDRHINEPIDNKICFLENVIKNHDVLHFDEVCWTAFEKLLYSLNVYHFSVDKQNNVFRNTVSRRQDRILNFYLVLSIKYYIIHQKPIQSCFLDFIIANDGAMWRMRQGFDKEKDRNNLDKIFQYLLSCFTAHARKLFPKIKDEEINSCIWKILELLVIFDKTFEDTSESIKSYVMLNFNDFKHHHIFNHVVEPLVPEFCMSDIMHYLKQDASLVVKEFPKIREYFQKTSKRSKKNINWLIKKLQIYFSHDLAPEYLNLLNECLHVEELHPQTARVAIYGIFNLSDEEHKIAFLKRYVPSESKIDHVNVCRNLLTIQIAICSEACHARPPLPFANYRDYIKGDYLQFCISIFDAYMANLTPAQCLSFVESLLDSPVSVQKHGLRLAFHYFSTENLKTLVMKVWKKTKNVSLRKVLYKAMFNKINYYHDNLPAQFELFEVLTVMTKSLHQDDDEELFILLSSRLPYPVMGSFLEVGYNVVKDFPKRLINFERFARIINALEQQIQSVPPNFVRDIMEEHVTDLLDHNLLHGEEINHGYHTKVINAKWNLVKTSVIKHMDLHILNIVMDKALANWQQKQTGYIYRKFVTEFLNDLENLSFQNNVLNYSELNKVFLAIISKMESCIPSIQIYILVWQLRTSILVRQSLDECKPNQIYSARIAISKYASGIKDLIKEYIKKDMFLKSFHVEIKNIIEDGVQKIGRRFSDNCKDREMVHILFCSALLECDNRETQIMIVDLLPQVYSGTFKEYYDVIDKLKSIDDKELQYLMNYRINCSDYRYRVYTN